MLFRKDMSGYPLGTFFIAIFFPSNLFSSPSGCSLATLPRGYLSAARSIGQA